MKTQVNIGITTFKHNIAQIIWNSFEIILLFAKLFYFNICYNIHNLKCYCEILSHLL